MSITSSTADSTIRKLCADKSVLLSALEFASICDAPSDFARAFMDGTAFTDPEWGDWQDSLNGLVLDGKAAREDIAGQANYFIRGGSLPHRSGR